MSTTQQFSDAERQLLIVLATRSLVQIGLDPEMAHATRELTAIVAKLSGTDTVLIAQRAYPVKMEVPPDGYHTPPGAAKYYDVTRLVIRQAREEMGDEIAFSLIASALTRELRKVVGLAAAIKVLRDLADTMTEVATKDDPDS